MPRMLISNQCGFSILQSFKGRGFINQGSGLVCCLTDGHACCGQCGSPRGFRVQGFRGLGLQEFRVEGLFCKVAFHKLPHPDIAPPRPLYAASRFPKYTEPYTRNTLAYPKL